MSLDIAELKAWTGRQEVREDVVMPVPIAALAATLDRDDPPTGPGTELPPLWHWLYFLPLDRQSQLGPDGHARRGDFLPPVPLRRRMYAGGRLDFRRALRVGDAVRRTSTVVDVNLKEGRTGPLVFVLVRHEIATAEGLALVEEHDIVYRDLPNEGEPAPMPRPAPAEAPWRRDIHPDDVLLFRYSALTFNGHRIHYDRRYAMAVEGYPGLVIHGPLLATLLADLVRRNTAAPIKFFRFRAMQPLFDAADFAVCGQPAPDGHSVALWAQGADGALAMEAQAELGEGTKRD